MIKKNSIKIFIISGVIFIISIVLGMWRINDVGRTWDEPAQAIDGYNFIELIINGDFKNKYLYDHPYHPPLTKYLYGIAAHFDIESKNSPAPFFLKREPLFKYDWMSVRLVSVLFSALSCLLVFLIAKKYFGLFIGFFSGIILSTLPIFLGMSQLATIESVLVFTFTATVYSFLLFIEKPNKFHTTVTGVILGLAFLTKYTNILLIPLMFSILIVWVKFGNNKSKSTNMTIFSQTLLIIVISFIVFFIFWPMPFFHLSQFIESNTQLRFAQTAHSVPEVFFGRLMFVPKIYYFIFFLITTPFITLLLFFIGAKKLSYLLGSKSFKSKRWIIYSVIFWFCLPFIQSFYNFRQQGIRYIIEIYAPFSIIAAIGMDFLLSLIKNQKKRILVVVIFFIYLLVVLIRISPYYIDYFNIVVGGSKGVYEKKLFHLGWWGEGIKEATTYLKKNAPKNSTVGAAVMPLTSIPPVTSLLITEYNDKNKYDYVMVGYFNIIREKFDSKNVTQNYFPIYDVLADGAKVITVYKHK